MRAASSPRRPGLRDRGGAPLLELGDLAREALRAVLGELLELGLERRDALLGAVVADVGLRVGLERLDDGAPPRGALLERGDRLARGLEPRA